jgi:hypothetical protein
VGLPAVRSVLANPAFELCALIVNSPEKEGRDAGELAGCAPCAIRATRDPGVVLDAPAGERPDALVYAVNQDFRPLEARAEMCRALAAGIDVVTAGLYALLHPPSAHPSVRDPFERACRAGKSTFLSSGIDPGFATDLLPLVLSGLCAEIHEIRIVENFNYATYDVPREVRKIIGFGSSMQETPLMILPGVPASVWGPALCALAAGLDLGTPEIREEIDTHPLERDVQIASGERLAAGTLGAFRFEVQAWIDGAPLLVVEHVTRISDDTAPHWPRARGMGHHQVRMRGSPDVTLTLESTDAAGDHVAGGNATAAARLVGAIPFVCAAPPGLLSGAEVPAVYGRGLVRPRARS